MNVSIFDLNVQLMIYVSILSSTICINITLFILQWLSVSQCAFFGESRKSGKKISCILNVRSRIYTDAALSNSIRVHGV